MAREPVEPDDDATGTGTGAGIAPTPTATPPPSGYSGPVVSGPDLGGLPDYGGARWGRGCRQRSGNGVGGSGPGAPPGGSSAPPEGQPTPQPASDLGTFAERVIAASTEPITPKVDDEPIAPYVAGGLGLLALALRRRIPLVPAHAPLAG